MIARIWRGVVRRDDAEAYVNYIVNTGMAEYRSTPGNQGAWMLRRDGAIAQRSSRSHFGIRATASERSPAMTLSKLSSIQKMITFFSNVISPCDTTTSWVDALAGIMIIISRHATFQRSYRELDPGCPHLLTSGGRG